MPSNTTFTIKISPSLLQFARSVPGLLAVRFQQYMFRAEAQAKKNVEEGGISGLHVRSGTLRRNIASRVEQNGRQWLGYLGAHVVYAAIHEFGGTIPAHQVVARNVRALHWIQDGQDRFAKSVQIPDVRMPKRPYLMPALKSEANWLIAALKQDMRNRSTDGS
jgi:phage gpG-like protein